MNTSVLSRHVWARQWFAAATLLILPMAMAIAQPVVTVSATDATAAETGSTGAVTFFVDEVQPQDLLIEIDIGGTAVPGDGGDYAPLPTQVTLPAGRTSVTLFVQPFRDNQSEGLETVIVSLLPGETYQPGDPQRATVTILDEQTAAPVTVNILAIDAEAAEQNNDPATVAIEIASGTNPQGLTVTFELRGTAAPDDLQPLSRSITLPPGSLRETLTLTPVDDNLAEPPETVEILLTTDGQYVVGNRALAQITIADNDQGAGAPGNGASPLASVRADTEQTARVNDAVTLRLTALDADNRPLPGAAVDWVLNQAGIDAGGALTNADAFTNGDGQAAAVLTTGAAPAVYQITATVTAGNADPSSPTQTIAFTITAGLIDTTAADTPEAAIASALDTLCPRLATAGELSPAQQNLLNRCNELLSNTNDAEVARNLRQIAPDDAPAQGDTAAVGIRQQLSGVGRRLSALRRGITGISLDQLSLRSGETLISGELLKALADGRGGSAGAIGAEEETSLPERLGLFLSGSLGDGSQLASTNEAGFEYDHQSLTLGIDYRLTPRWVIGTAAGVTIGDIGIADNGGRLKSKGTQWTLYTTWYRDDKLYLDALLSLGRHRFDTQRHISYQSGATSLQRTATGTTDGRNGSLSIGGGYELASRSGLTTELFGRIERLDITIDGYRETGAQEFDLALAKQSIEATRLVFGAQLDRAISMKWGILLPQMRWTVFYDGQDTETIRGTFANDPFDTVFEFSAEEPDPYYFYGTAGIAAIFAQGASAFLQYEQLIGYRRRVSRDVTFGMRISRSF